MKLGHDLRHLVTTLHELTERGIGLQGLAGEGAAIDTTTVSGELAFSVFAAVAEFERARISERTIGALVAARPREGERSCTRTAAKVYLGMATTGAEGVREWYPQLQEIDVVPSRRECRSIHADS